MSIRAQKDEVYTIVEEVAEFPGGTQAMMKYISSNIQYPANAREQSMGGKVFLKFIVNENGDIEGAEVIKSTGIKSIDDEALRVVKAMPQWKPAKMTGRNVKCYFNLPINFSLDSPYFIFNTKNENDKYQQGTQAALEGDLKTALSMYQQDTGDIEAWFNMGVIHYLQKDKKEARKLFENVKANASPDSQYYRLSNQYLTKYF